VKTFLIENDIELPTKFWKRLSRRIKGNAQTDDRIPTTDELKQILIQMPQHAQAYYITLCSSGMRGGELLQIKLSEIDLDTDPVQIRIRGEYTKNKIRRTTFITNEAKQFILEWLKVREQHLITATKKSSGKKDEQDPRLFPFSSENILVTWHLALQKTGLDQRDPTTDRYLLHPHCLRKYFRTHLATQIPVDVVEALMGHSGYLTQAYRRYTIEQLGELYKKGEGTLNIFSDTQEINKIKTKLEKRNDQFQELINGLTSANLTLKKDMKELKGTVSSLNTQISIIEKTLLRKLREIDQLYQGQIEDQKLIQLIEEKLSLSKIEPYTFEQMKVEKVTA